MNLNEFSEKCKKFEMAGRYCKLYNKCCTKYNIACGYRFMVSSVGEIRQRKPDKIDAMKMEREMCN